MNGGLPPFREGCLDRPIGPGLSAEFDPERVARSAERFQRDGEFSAFGF